MNLEKMEVLWIQSQNNFSIFYFFFFFKWTRKSCETYGSDPAIMSLCFGQVIKNHIYLYLFQTKYQHQLLHWVQGMSRVRAGLQNRWIWGE